MLCDRTLIVTAVSHETVCHYYSWVRSVIPKLTNGMNELSSCTPMSDWVSECEMQS